MKQSSKIHKKAALICFYLFFLIQSTHASKNPLINQVNKGRRDGKKSLAFQRLSMRGGNTASSTVSTNNDNISDRDSIISTSLKDTNAFDEKDSSFPLEDIVYGMTYAHAMNIDELLQSVRGSSDRGLSSNEATRRQNVFGQNVLQEPPKETLFQQLIQQFDDKLVQVLLGVAVLSAGFASFERSAEAFIEPIIILTILMINAAVGVVQSASASDALDALHKLQAQTVTVLRDGVWKTEVPSSNLVPGDIISLRVGDRVPADARIISVKSSALYIDEASLTGESTVVFKNAEPVDVTAHIAGKSNMVFSGTIVTSGNCIAVVTGTGMTTEMGKIDAGVLAAKALHPKTPLELQLDEFGHQLAGIVALICVIVWMVNIPKFSSSAFGSTFKGALHYAKVAVALGVAAIPEGLPAVITLCLSLGTSRMAKRRVIVRKLPSVETLGCTTVICTDKTGTLTTGQMSVTTLLTFSPLLDLINIVEHTVQGISYEPTGEIVGLEQESIAPSLLQDIIAISSLCNDAKVTYKDGQYKRIGEPTEAAFKVFAEKLGSFCLKSSSSSLSSDSSEYIKQRMSDRISSSLNQLYTRIALLEFNRDRKSMGVIVSPKKPSNSEDYLDLDADDSYMKIHKPSSGQLLVKGAAEMVIKRCNRLKLSDGSIIRMTDNIRQQLLSSTALLAARPLRCLALACKETHEFSLKRDTASLATVTDEAAAARCDILKDSTKFAVIENDMILVAMCGIKDPARPEVYESIARCSDAGIRVMMITGDSKETAISIARDVGIFDGTEDLATSAFTGEEFFSLTREEQKQVLSAREVRDELGNIVSKSKNKVFCRTEPRDKQYLVQMLQEDLDEVVAMTGDGVNDAPALQQAAIGVAMGITGTDAAKSAADMILADDNFAAIVSAVEEGRNIYNNMQTFCCFLISSNIGEVILMAGAALLGFPEPLLPLHLLWINLVTDGPPATALGFNPADPGVMQQRPRSKNQSILTKWMLIRYIVTGAYVGLAAISCYYSWFASRGVSFAQLRAWESCDEWTSIFTTNNHNAVGHPETCALFSKPNLLRRPQSMALASLVCMELLKALSAVSLQQSMFTIQPWKNPWLLAGVLFPALLHLAVMYTPILSQIFSISRLSLDEWKTVLRVSLPILLVEEILKFIGRIVTKTN